MKIKISPPYFPYLAVLCLIVIGSVLRLYNLGFISFWLDEAATDVFTQQSISTYWQLVSNLGEVHPPLFYLVEKIILPFGTSEFLYRLFPAIFGIATIPLFYIIGKKMFGSPVGIIMAILITFSPFHVIYSQDARMYTMLLFLTGIALIFYLYAIHSNNIKYWIAFGLVSALAIWTHFIAFIFIGALIIYSIFHLIKGKKSPKNLLLSIIVITIFISPLILIMKGLFTNRIASDPTWGLKGIDFIGMSLALYFGIFWLPTLILAILFCFGAAWLFKNEREKFYFLLSIPVISLGVGLVLSYRMPMNPRYLIFLLPFLYAVVASAALPILQRINEKRVIIIFLVLIIGIWAQPLYTYYNNTPNINGDWRSASVFIKNTAKANDIIIVMPDYNQIPFNYYYNNSTYGTLQINTDSVDDLEKINSTRCKNNISAFIVFNLDIKTVDPSGELMSWVLSERTTAIQDFNGVVIEKITANC